MPVLTLREIAHTLDCPPQPDFPIAAISCDSRSVAPGSLFCALKGARVDGHQFLAEVAAKGAYAAFVSQSYSGPDCGLRLLRVPDVLVALQELAIRVLRRHQPRIVGVTGSLGKTTTKGFLSTLLGTTFRVAASPGNSNSQVGLPLAILNHTRGDEELLILEMGMTGAGQIKRLVEIAPPTIALITTVDYVHAGYFESLAAIGQAKAEIFSHPDTRLGILSRDIAHFDELCRVGACPKRSFSTSQTTADYFLADATLHAHKQQRTVPPVDLKSAHNRHNLLAALAVALELGVDWDALCHALPQLTLPERRLETVQLRGVTFLNDSYNAAQSSVKSALRSLPEPAAQGRKIAVLGPMPELGKFSADQHEQLGRFALDHVDCLFCLGEECLPMVEVWKRAGRSVFWFETREELTQALEEHIRAGDVVLIKGANRCQLWTILAELHTR